MPRPPNKFLTALMFSMVTMVALRAESDAGKELGNYLTSHGYGVVKVDRSGTNRQVVRAQINGQNVSLMIDTGFSHTSLTASCAEDLKLDVRKSNLASFGVGGLVEGRDSVALVKSFTLGGAEINRLNIVPILPSTAHTPSEDGFFGYDYLYWNAVILPVGARVILFKPGKSTPPPIDRYMEALGLKPIPLHYVHGGLRVEGHLNGHPLTAVVDCGAELSSFDLDYLNKIPGLQVNKTRLIANGIDGHPMETYDFTPQSFDIGALTIPPMELASSRMPIFAHGGFNALLGYELLASHHAILDLGHGVLWMK